MTSSAKLPPPKPLSNGESWNCSQCTYSNKGGIHTCDMCGFDNNVALKEKENITSQIPFARNDIPPPPQPQIRETIVNMTISTAPVPAPIPIEEANPVPTPVVIVETEATIPTTTTEESEIDSNSPKIDRSGSGSPVTPTGKKTKRVSIAGGLFQSEVDQHGRSVSTLHVQQSSTTVSAPKVSRSLAHLPVNNSREQLEEIDIGNSSSIKQTSSMKQTPSIKSRKTVMATSLGGIANELKSIPPPRPIVKAPEPTKKRTFFACCSKNVANQVAENRPKEHEQTVEDPQVDNSWQMPPPANQTWLDSNIFVESFKNYLARPVYSHVLEPVGNASSIVVESVGNASQTYVAGPVYSHVLEPVGSASQTYVAGPIVNASQTYVAGPIYSHVVEPVGSATQQYVIAPVGSAVGTGQQQPPLTVPDDKEQKPQPITPLKNPDDLAQQQQHPPNHNQPPIRNPPVN